MTDDAPAYRLYTSKQAAERAGGGLTESFFDRIAASRQVEATYAGRRLRWTDAQIAAAVAHHARGGTSADAPQQAAPSTRSPRTARPNPAQAPRVPGAVTPLRAKPGNGRYGRAS